MFKIAKTLHASLIAGGAILSGPAHSAYMDLPEEANFYNRATDTAVNLKCSHNMCTVRAVGNQAQIDLTQTFTYADKEIIAGVPSQRGWSNDSFVWGYDATKKVASSVEWEAGSKMAMALFGNEKYMIQNDIMKISRSGKDAVSVCSYAPTGDNHGLGICIEFNDASHAVEMSVVPVASFGNAIVKAENVQSLERSYNSYDHDYYDGYASQLNGKSEVYSLRR